MKIKKDELLKAVEKASISVKDNYIVNISNRKSSDGSYYANICASDGNALTLTTFMVSSVKEPVGFITGPELFGVLKALGEFGDEYDIKVEETFVSVTVGSASAPVSLKTEGTSFPISMPKEDDDSCIYASIVKDDYIKAVRQGSFAYGGAGCISGIINTVAINPITGEKNKFAFVSTDGRLVVRSEVEVEQVSKGFKKSENLYINVDAPAMRKILSKLEGENIALFIFDKQVLIKDGNDFYAIMRYETMFPESIGKMLNATEYSYKAILDVPMLKAAIDVATITGGKNQASVIDIQNGKITVSSILGNNKANVKGDSVEGEINIHINPENFKMVIDNTGAKTLTVYGCGDLRPMYMSTDSFRGLMTPIAKTTDSETDKETDTK